MAKGQCARCNVGHGPKPCPKAQGSAGVPMPGKKARAPVRKSAPSAKATGPYPFIAATGIKAVIAELEREAWALEDRARRVRQALASVRSLNAR